MQLDLLTALNAERAARRAAIVVTNVESGRQRLVKAADIARDPLRAVLAEHLRTSKSGMEESAEGRVFLTVYVPAPQLVITGAVHISQTLAPIAKLLGYDVTIVDPRTAFASIERFPDVKVIAEWPDKALPPLGIDRYTAFVALTHDPKIDDPALTHALSRDCFYIGALGSKKTHARRVERLRQQGLTDADIARIHAPIGLAIGAVSPAEIAVAIMAQITERLREDDRGAAPDGQGRVMKFGPVAPQEAIGATAVHTIRQGTLVLKKGTLIGPVEAATLDAGGIKDIVVARLEPDDVSEDVAAAEIAAAITGEGVHVDRAFTGRANLFAEMAGVLVVDKDAVDRLNRVDEAITVATLPAYKPVVPGEMIATVKIIPFAVAKAARDLALAAAPRPLVRVAPYRIRKVGVVSTVLPGLSSKVIEKTLKITNERLAPAGAAIVAERRVPHERVPLARALKEVLASGAELAIIFGASAIADRRDVIPAALEAVGGRIEHFGMPVDPGNLLLIGTAGEHPVLGAPGCARSPKENGFDWVLMRLLAGLSVPREDITGMGVGGLLMEIVTRPQPRDEPLHPVRNVAALVLAAGRSSRMGGSNKLLAEIGGRPLVRIVVDEVLRSRARPIIVVTGHQRERVEAALAGLPVDFVHNPKFADGLGTSLKTGVAAVPAQADGVIVCLGDMPQVDAALIDRLIVALDPGQGALVALPTIGGQRGNPVVWSRRFFPDLMAVEGDVGARYLIGRYAEAVVEVPLTGNAALTDIDTPEAFEAVKAELEGT